MSVDINLNINKTTVGLSNVDNTADSDKPVSSATLTELNLKEALINKVTSIFTDPNNTTYPTTLAVKQAIDEAVTSIVAGAPNALDTLLELSAALGDDANFAANVANELATKVDKVTGKGLSTEDYTPAEKTKLAGIATGATANSSDAQLRDRTTHTGTQDISTVTGLQTALDGKMQEATAATGTVIDFTQSKIFNSVVSPATGNFTDNLTGAKIGIVQKIYHNSGTAPTVPAGWVKLGSANYATSVLNIIYADFVGGSRVEYWIV
jgi:hypothetical protein